MFLLVAFFLYQTYKLMKRIPELWLSLVSNCRLLLSGFWFPQVLEMRWGDFDKFISVGFLVLVILFQDEIRRFLVALGSHRGWKFLGKIFFEEEP